MTKADAISSKSSSQKKLASFLNKKEQTSFFKPLIQPKLTINQPGDKYEQEADAVAEKVMKMPDVKTEPLFFQPKPSPLIPVQRKCTACEQEEKLQRKEEGQEDEIQLKSSKEFDVQRKCEHCEHEEKLHRKEAVNSSGNLTAPSSVSDVTNSTGQRLDSNTRNFMESRMGHDFGDVQIHNDSLAHKSSSEINALAYTHKNHVVFGAGQYQPNSDSGKQLLAHELAHVVQQRNKNVGLFQTMIQRKPAACDTIVNPLEFIVKQLSKRFVDPDDPKLALRAKCLREATEMLTPDQAINFAILIMEQDKENEVYLNFKRLATETRLSIAEILAKKIKKQDTSTYIARVREISFTLGNIPTVLTTLLSNNQLMQITLDDFFVGLASASLIAGMECEKYVFGITQFSVDDEQVATYHSSKVNRSYESDVGVKVRPKLPCQDVFNKGDIWSYVGTNDCTKKTVEILFMDKPSTAIVLFSNMPDMNLTGFKWKNKFVTIFSVILPNGFVHHLKWFDWEINYCETFENRKAGQPIGKSSGVNYSVKSSPVSDGAPSMSIKDQVGKPSTITCNNIVKGTPADIKESSTIIKCS
jgi:hypothetical protein